MDNLERTMESEILDPNTNNVPKKTPSTKKDLTPSERSFVNEISNKLELTDSTAIMQYGSPVQTKISKFSDSVLQNVRTKDTGVVGKDLSGLVETIQGFDVEAEKKPKFSLFGLGKSVKRQINRLITDYSNVENNIDKIVGSLEAHQRTLLKDVNILDTMYNNNYEYFKELSLYIIAGEEKLEKFRAVDISAQQKIAEETRDQMEAQKLNDMVNQAERFEKKLHDLKMSRTISIQMAPQIRLIQNNNTVLVEKIQSSIVNSIPLWKNQIVIALGIANSQDALAAQKRVTDMTNELLLKNSEMLKQGSLEIAEESERSIVSIETLQKTNANLIETINGVLEIQRKGSEARASAEEELSKIENDLKNTLLEANNR